MASPPNEDELARRRYETFSARPDGQLVPREVPSRTKYVILGIVVAVIMTSVLGTIAYVAYRYFTRVT